jgi:prevent-host-death family protein
VSLVPVRELRNNTAEVIERARNGEEVVITVNGTPAATLVAIVPTRKPYLTATEILALRSRAPDLTLAVDIANLTSDSTDDLPPLR